MNNTIRSLVAAGLAGLAVFSPAAHAQNLPPPKLSPVLPFALPPHNTPTPLLARPFFDYFSWQSFIALNWPVRMGADGYPLRGRPNTNQTISAPGLRVWESYKEAYELFQPGGAPPSPWNSFSNAVSPCGPAAAGAKVLAMVAKSGSLLDEFNEAFAGPLIDQNRNYVRYEIRVNEVEYNVVRSNKWYLSANVPTNSASPVNFPSSSTNITHYGALELKAAWRELVPGKDDFNRFYHSTVTIVNPGQPPTCRTGVVAGLVGLHIGHKVAPFREWIWSTFEHISNVPPDSGPVKNQKYSFNSGTSTPGTTNGFSYQPVTLSSNKPLPPKSRRTPVQVTRFTPIPANPAEINNTTQINQMFWKLLAGTVWTNYQLVVTQWPTTTGQFSVNGDYPTNCDSPFPLVNVANTAAETYFQNGESCMNCHYGAAQQDFSWILNLRPYSPNQDKAARKQLLQRIGRRQK